MVFKYDKYIWKILNKYGMIWYIYDGYIVNGFYKKFVF